jgi:hypothetical protein
MPSHNKTKPKSPKAKHSKKEKSGVRVEELFEVVAVQLRTAEYHGAVHLVGVYHTLKHQRLESLHSLAQERTKNVGPLTPD